MISQFFKAGGFLCCLFLEFWFSWVFYWWFPHDVSSFFWLVVFIWMDGFLGFGVWWFPFFWFPKFQLNVGWFPEFGSWTVSTVLMTGDFFGLWVLAGFLSFGGWWLHLNISPSYFGPPLQSPVSWSSPAEAPFSDQQKVTNTENVKLCWFSGHSTQLVPHSALLWPMWSIFVISWGSKLAFFSPFATLYQSPLCWDLGATFLTCNQDCLDTNFV